VLTAVLMIDHEIRFANEGISSEYDAIENVEIATAGQRRASIQRFVEAAKPFERRAAEDHVRAGAENSRAARIGGRFGKPRAEADPLEGLSESAHPLEHDLRFSLEFERENGSGERARIGIRRPSF